MWLAFVLTDLGALGGNNLVVLVASVGWAALIVDAALGWLNVRAVTARRQLPDELFARTACRGAFVVERSGRLSARAITVDDGFASATVERLEDPTVVLSAWWTLPQRGPASLRTITVSSGFPFGLFRHTRELDVPAEVLVYPCARPGTSRPSARPSVEGDANDRREGTGDLRDLRPYRAGDRLRAIHWPTSARTGRPMVGVRAAEEDAGRVVEVPPTAGEATLESVAGAVLDAWDAGVPVGLSGVDPKLAVPRRGVRWRRRLLEALALRETA